MELLLILGGITTNLIMLFVAWVKFKTTLAGIGNDLKNHADVSIQKLNGMLTYFIHSAGRPMWIKAEYEEHGKHVFRMLECNHNYTDLFGIKRQDYIGKTDLEAGIEKPQADKIYETDLKIWATQQPENVVEIIDGKPMRFRKLPLQTPDGTKKGVMGYAIDCGDPTNCPIVNKSPSLKKFMKDTRC